MSQQSQADLKALNHATEMVFFTQSAGWIAISKGNQYKANIVRAERDKQGIKGDGVHFGTNEPQMLRYLWFNTAPLTSQVRNVIKKH